MKGIAKTMITESQLSFQKMVGKNSFVVNPKVQGYQKTTDEFKKESGYQNIRVPFYNLETELETIFAENLEKEVPLPQS